MDAIHVGIYDAWADWEAGHALAHLGSGDWAAGRRYRIVLTGADERPVTTKAGITLVPEVRIDQVDPRESAMLVLPGADTWLAGANDAFVDVARRFLAAGRPVAAICGATVGLARGGLLDDRRHTSNAPQLLEGDGYRGHPHYSFEPAVTDGDLITASGIAPVEFARAIFARLRFYDEATADSWYRLYGEHDPEGYFGLLAAAGAN